MKRLVLSLICLTLGSVAAAQDFDSVQIETVKVAEGIYMLVGRGGNIGLSVGEDTSFLIDDQYAPLTEKIQKAVSEVTSKQIEFVLNTHYHGDHTGGNENLGKAGVLIVAHDNVRQRMSVEQFMKRFNRTVPPAPPKALPVVTFSEKVTFHLNGEEIHAFHLEPGHTDGDSVIHFRKSDVFHMGDLYFNGGYPFIDLSSGGNANGVIAAANMVLSMSSDQTKIIPGHGPLADRHALTRYRDMLLTVRDRVQALINSGKSLEEVQQAQPSREFDEEWGKGFINPEAFVQSLYESLKPSAS